MNCFIDSVKTDTSLSSDIRATIPDAGMRRRMSRLLRKAVATAVECCGGTERLKNLDAIITATGWGFLEDSGSFLRNIISTGGQMLNPTPFIQSTFNTAGGYLARLGLNHCYNITYVNRSHSFEDALLDAAIQITDEGINYALVCAFDEQTPDQQRIMERMGLFRNCKGGEGAASVLLSSKQTDKSLAMITGIHFLSEDLSREECLKRFASIDNTVLIYNGYAQYGLFPVAAAMCFVHAATLCFGNTEEAIIYNKYLGGTPTVIILKKCI